MTSHEVSSRFYDWCYVTADNTNVKFPESIQRRLENKYYEAVHELYNRDELFLPIVVIKDKAGQKEVINVIENTRIVETDRKFVVNPVYRVPHIRDVEKGAVAIQDLGKCNRWVVKARADEFVLDESAFFQSSLIDGKDKPVYQAFKVHSIHGKSPSVGCTSMQLLPHMPLIVANIGKNSFGRNWEIPQIVFSASSKSTKRMIGVHIQITPKVLADMKTNFKSLSGRTMEFEFRPNKDSKIIRKGSFEYLCLEGKHVRSQASVCMVVGVHVFSE